MSNLYTLQGIDFDTWFSRGTGKQNFYIFGDDGQDIGEVYTAGSGGPATGFHIASGEDLNTKLGGYGYGIYRVAGVPWMYYSTYKNYNMSAQTSYWTTWLKNWRSKKGGVKCVSGITNDACYYWTNSNFAYSQLVFVYNPDQTNKMEFSYSWGGVDWLGGWGECWCNFITIDEWLKGIVISPRCGAGCIIRQPCYMTLKCNGYNEVKYNCLYGAANDSGVPESNTTGSGWGYGSWAFHA